MVYQQNVGKGIGLCIGGYFPTKQPSGTIFLIGKLQGPARYGNGPVSRRLASSRRTPREGLARGGSLPATTGAGLAVLRGLLLSSSA